MLDNRYDIDEVIWKKNFAFKFNNLIAEKGVSINKAATEIGVDGKTLRSYSTGTSVPSAIIIHKLADYFDVSTDYLLDNLKKNVEFSENTIIELANIIKNIDVIVRVNESDDVVSLHINDKILTAVLEELYYNRKADNYENIVDNLAHFYGKMKVHNGKVIDYDTFEKLVYHRFVYHGLEEDCFPCVDENGNDCIAVDDWEADDEIQRREKLWCNMNASEREDWWLEYNKSQS